MKGREITRDGRQRWTVGSIGECIHPTLPARRSAGAFLSSHFVRQARHEVHRAGHTADISAVRDILQLRSIGLDKRLSGPTRNASSTWIPSCRSSIAVRAAERWFAEALSPRSQEIVDVACATGALTGSYTPTGRSTPPENSTARNHAEPTKMQRPSSERSGSGRFGGEA